MAGYCSRCGRPMPNASASSANSIAGTGAAPPHARTGGSGVWELFSAARGPSAWSGPAQNALLQATASGIGAVGVGTFDAAWIQRLMAMAMAEGDIPST